MTLLTFKSLYIRMAQYQIHSNENYDLNELNKSINELFNLLIL